MEYLLHYTWKHRLFPLKELFTTDGLPVEVVDVGLHNTDSGPDFFNAKIKIDGTMWVGNVEIHLKSSDWYAHSHNEDKAYDNVILHVVETDDLPAINTEGKAVATLQLPIPQHVRENYSQLMRTDSYPPCYRIIPSLPLLTVHSFLSALQTERLNQKAERIENQRLKHDLNWEDAFFVTMARNFGFSVNGEAFENWAQHIPLRAVDKHRDNLFQIEAIFFGQAALLEGEDTDNDYYNRMKKEYRYLAHKFGMKPIQAVQWRFLRMRPTNFPHIRLAQLANLYHKSEGLLSQLIEAETTDEVCKLLTTEATGYWKTHYTFKHESPSKTKSLSQTSKNLLIINTVAPFLYAYGRYKGNEGLCLRAINFLEQLKAEDNHIVRTWEQCGLKVNNAADSQALIQLKREYCDVRKCLYCRFGYEYLRATNGK